MLLQLDCVMESVSIRNGSDLEGIIICVMYAYPAQLERDKQY